VGVVEDRREVGVVQAVVEVEEILPQLPNQATAVQASLVLAFSFSAFSSKNKNILFTGCPRC
jgi:hypothetical protein